MTYNLKHYAHIGDAVWELFIREHAITKTQSQNELHKLTTSCVCAAFQTNILEKITPNLTAEEQELARRGRNLPLTINKKNNQNVHRYATSFEVLIGFWYLNDKQRLDEIFSNIKKYLN